MNDKKYEKYILEVKDWSNKIGAILQEHHVEQGYLQPKEQIDDFLDKMVAKMERKEIEETDLKLIEDQARKLYEHAFTIQEGFAERSSMTSHRIKIGQHKLPPLPYPYDALEPYISSEIMKLHHDKHHRSYVEGLNKAEKMMEKARNTGDYSLIKHWEREASFNGSGHYLHTIFWNNMSPEDGGQPKGNLYKQIEMDFESFDQFKKHFSEAANKVEGVGWAILVWSLHSQRLEILQSEKHQNLTQWETIPLLVLDVWEHAYYLQYKNDRNKYIENWWNIVNWKDVSNRFQKAQIKI